MYVDPSRSIAFSSMLQASNDLNQQYQSGQFGSLVQGLLGGFDQASKATQDQIWALEKLHEAPSPRWVNGVFSVQLEDLALQRNKLLQAFTQATNSLCKDYGVDTTQTVRFDVDASGKVLVTSPHPDKALIEDLINRSSLLRNSVYKIVSDSNQLNVSILTLMGKADPETVKRMQDGLSFVMEGGPDGLVGEVHLEGKVVASSDWNAEFSATMSELDAAIKRFDAVDRQLHEERLEELARNKAADTERRTQAELQHKKDLADKLADREAAERAAELHPEQGYKPVFI